MILKFKQFCKSLLAVVFATALVLTSFSAVAPTTVAGPNTGIVLAQASKYTTDLQPLRDRLPELESYVDDGDWNNIRAFIRGPLGELGPLTRHLGDELPTSTQKRGRRTIKLLADHLNKLDAAAAKNNSTTAAREYDSVVSTFDQVLSLS